MKLTSFNLKTSMMSVSTLAVALHRERGLRGRDDKALRSASIPGASHISRFICEPFVLTVDSSWTCLRGSCRWLADGHRFFRLLLGGFFLLLFASTWAYIAVVLLKQIIRTSPHNRGNLYIQCEIYLWKHIAMGEGCWPLMHMDSKLTITKPRSSLIDTTWQ